MQSGDKSKKALVLTLGPKHDKPWWWSYINTDPNYCELSYHRISLGGKTSSQISTLDLPYLLVKMTVILFKALFKYNYVFTFECDFTSFIISFLQSMMFLRIPKHVILQFIMREKEDNLRSRLKYAFMQFCFRSVYMAICSSRSEADYYREVFGWDRSKVQYAPMHTDPRFLKVDGANEGGFILSAGKSFRDYETFLVTIREMDVPTVIVASQKSIDCDLIPENVMIKYDVPFEELCELMRKCTLIVLPLQNKRISVGQSILLQAMAMGKAVVVTETAGTRDYIRHMFDGIFLEAGNREELRSAVRRLLEDEGLRNRLGRNARERVEREHLPQHYFDRVARIVGSRVTRKGSCR